MHKGLFFVIALGCLCAIVVSIVLGIHFTMPKLNDNDMQEMQDSISKEREQQNLQYGIEAFERLDRKYGHQNE